MKPETALTITTKEQARDVAIDWQHTVGASDISYSELAEWGDALNALAVRFDLVDEFKENAII